MLCSFIIYSCYFPGKDVTYVGQYTSPMKGTLTITNYKLYFRSIEGVRL